MPRLPAARTKQPRPEDRPSDWVLVVDDDKNSLRRMKNALARTTSPPKAEFCSDFLAAEQYLRCPLPPIAIVADLDMGLGYRNGADFLLKAQRDARRQGKGFWPIVVSKVGEPEALSQCEHMADDFRVRTFSKWHRGWSTDCASYLSSLFLPVNAAPELGSVSPGLPLNDRVFWYSQASMPSSELYEMAEPLVIPERLVENFPENPVLMYRGQFFPIAIVNAERVLTTFLARWRTVSARRVHNANETPIDWDEIRVSKSRGGTIPDNLFFEPGYTAIEQAVSQFLNLRLLKELFKNSFEGNPLGFRIRARAQNKALGGRKPSTSLPIAICTSGFMSRLHFILDQQDKANFYSWRRWTDEGAGVSSANPR